MAQTGIHYKTKWLSADNSVNIQGWIMVLVHGTFSLCHLSIKQVSVPFLLNKIWAGQATTMKTW